MSKSARPPRSSKCSKRTWTSCAGARADTQPEQLDLLYRGAPAQIRSLVEAEGYFAAVIDATFDASAQPPVARFSVEPGEPLRIARTIGFDEIGISGSSGLDNQVVTLGKRLGERLYVTYEQGLSTTTRVIRLNVNLTQRLTLRVEGGGTTSALDLFYAFSFD